MTEEEFCYWIRDKWGDAYANNLEERVEAAVAFPHHDRYDHLSAWSWVGWVCRRDLEAPCLIGGGFLDADNLGLHPCNPQMYLDNVVALALGLEGYPDPPQSVVASLVTLKGYTGYVAPDFKGAAAPTAVVEPPAPEEPVVEEPAATTTRTATTKAAAK